MLREPVQEGATELHRDVPRPVLLPPAAIGGRAEGHHLPSFRVRRTPRTHRLVEPRRVAELKVAVDSVNGMAHQRQRTLVAKAVKLGCAMAPRHTRTCGPMTGR